jgi:AraC-like DNA-binding protein
MFRRGLSCDTLGVERWMEFMQVRRQPRPGCKSPPEQSSFWRPRGLDDIDFFAASFREHSYARHSHEGYAVGVTDRGAQTFLCRGERRVSGAGSAVIINPGDAHDGRAAAPDGYSYRMIYIGERHFVRAIGEITGQPGFVPLFREPIITNGGTARLVAELHDLAAGGAEALKLETVLLRVLVHFITRFATTRPSHRVTSLDASLVRAVHSYLVRHLDEDPSLSDLAAVTGISRYHLLRRFRREVGMPPHAYLTQLRLTRARRLLAAGEPAARVAVAVGFVDQSHLIKRFRAAYGITPTQFSKASIQG